MKPDRIANLLDRQLPESRLPADVVALGGLAVHALRAMREKSYNQSAVQRGMVIGHLRDFVQAYDAARSPAP